MSMTTTRSAAQFAASCSTEDWKVQVPQPALPEDLQDRIAFPSRLLSTQVPHVTGAIDQDPPVSEGSRLRARELTEQWTKIGGD